jgi:redox-sensitive bicupin YhaK (pirin superfamily)
MNRKDFLRKSVLGVAAGSLAFAGRAFTTKENTKNNKPMDTKTAQYTFHAADSRGHANHGWLNSHHSFSFASYHNPERMQFGTLRVLNDDIVDAGMGFGKHPHENMEIVSIPLQGDLEHQDSMGNASVIRQGDVQIMSAGTGVYHSEYNKSKEDLVKFLQIWVFPKERNIEPRYDQKSYPVEDRQNRFQRVVSPEEDGSIWINQDAYFSLGNFEAGKSTKYDIAREGNGVYAFLIKGKATIDGHELSERDALGVSETNQLDIQFSEDSELLLLDVPMGLR